MSYEFRLLLPLLDHHMVKFWREVELKVWGRLTYLSSGFVNAVTLA